MSQDRNQTAGRRPRGRPKGTAPFEERDRVALSRFADQQLTSPGIKLAPFLKAEHYEEKDVRRAQLRWRRQKDEFLREARRRLDLGPSESIAQLIFNIVASIDAVANTARPGLEKLASSHERARRRARALEAIGAGQGLPLDLGNQAELDAAIERYEQQMFRSEEGRLAALGQQTLRDLPPSQKLYAAAIMLHELSLQMSDEAAGEPGSGSDDTLSKDEGGQ